MNTDNIEGAGLLTRGYHKTGFWGFIDWASIVYGRLRIVILLFTLVLAIIGATSFLQVLH